MKCPPVHLLPYGHSDENLEDNEDGDDPDDDKDDDEDADDDEDDKVSPIPLPFGPVS